MKNQKKEPAAQAPSVQIPAEVVEMIVNASVEMKADEMAFRREVLAVEKESLGILKEFSGSVKSLMNLFERKVGMQIDLQNESSRLRLEQERWEFEQNKAKAAGQKEYADREKLRI